MTTSSSSSISLANLLFVLFHLTMVLGTVHCWSSSTSHTPTRSTIKMDTESPLVKMPSFSSKKWSLRHQQHHRSNRTGNKQREFTSSAPRIPKNDSNNKVINTHLLPWIQTTNPTSEDFGNNVFLLHWKWQLEYFQQHLTNLRVSNTDCSEIDDLMYIETTSLKSNQDKQRIYTISLSSDEYRDIRMTYMSTSGNEGQATSQIFRCTCYPRNSMPILGMGMMQFQNGQRNVAIIDYQPLIQDMDDSMYQNQELYTKKLYEIRSKYSDLQQPMSNRHFNPNEKKYFTSHPIIGKWSRRRRNNKEDNDANIWKQLQISHQECVTTHVKLTKQNTGAKTNHDEIIKLHTDYDTFVASKEPASQLLGNAFGKDRATRLVHQVIFPLSQGGI